GRRRPGGPHRHRDDQHHRLLHEPRHLGRHHHGAGRRMTQPTATVPRSRQPAPAAPSRRWLKARRRLIGVVFLLVMALLVWLSIALYQKRFTPVAMVTLYTSSVGNEMHLGAEVKVRGVQVGEVRAIFADGSGARLELAIDPAMLARVPANVTAEM